MDPSAELDLLKTAISEARAALDVAVWQCNHSTHVDQEAHKQLNDLTGSSLNCVQLAEQLVADIQRQREIISRMGVELPATREDGLATLALAAAESATGQGSSAGGAAGGSAGGGAGVDGAKRQRTLSKTGNRADHRFVGAQRHVGFVVANHNPDHPNATNHGVGPG